MSDLSWLNPTPHAIAVYASQPTSPLTTQHSLPSGRYSLLGPDFHRLDRTSFAWRTHSHHLMLPHHLMLAISSGNPCTPRRFFFRHLLGVVCCNSNNPAFAREPLREEAIDPFSNSLRHRVTLARR